MKNWLKPSLNWLFVFIPVTLLLEHLQTAPSILFFSAALAIIPIAKLIVHSTEHLSTYTGDAVGGLLNATFGNAPELIILTVALKAGLHDMVLASLIGAILANLLLSLGLAFFIGGLRNHSQEYNAISARMYSSMMMVAVVSLIVPSSFSRFFDNSEALSREVSLNVGLAIVLLVAYVLYLFFSLKTHKDFFKSTLHSDEETGEHRWSLVRSVLTLVGASLLAAWMSEILVGAAEGTGEALGMTSVFIGIVFLAIIGGAAESFSTIAMAKKNKMDMAMNIALGSCIQIALFIAPLLVLISLFIGPNPLELAFTKAEIGALFLAVLIGTIIAGDGRSNWYKGVQLITVYLILAMLFFFLPEMN